MSSRDYKEQGFLLLRGVVDKHLVKEAMRVIGSATQLVLRRHGLLAPSEETQYALMALEQAAPDRMMDVIQVIKNCPEFYAFMSHPSLLGHVRTLLGTEDIHSVHDISQIRIDPPCNDARNFSWHQDYPYNAGAINALTAWIPLTPISKDMGLLRLVPKSHHDIIPVKKGEHVEPGTGRTHATIAIPAELCEKFDATSEAIPEMEPGDVLFFDACLVHASGINRGTRCRVVMNPRFSPMNDGALVTRGWQTMSDRNHSLFEELHPDKILAE